MCSIKGKVVAITGASSGIGEATARLLGADGAAVVLGARRTERLDEIARDVRERGGRALTCATDVTRREDLDRLVGLAVEEFGRLDVLVSNAGISKIRPMADLDVDGWSAMIDVNLRGVLHGIAAALPVFRPSGPGPSRDDGVDRRPPDRAHHGGLRRDQERRPHSFGRTAAGVDRRCVADNVGVARLCPHRTRHIPSTTPASASRSAEA